MKDGQQGVIDLTIKIILQAPLPEQHACVQHADDDGLHGYPLVRGQMARIKNELRQSVVHAGSSGGRSSNTSRKHKKPWLHLLNRQRRLYVQTVTLPQPTSEINVLE